MIRIDDIPFFCSLITVALSLFFQLLSSSLSSLLPLVPSLFVIVLADIVFSGDRAASFLCDPASSFPSYTDLYRLFSFALNPTTPALTSSSSCSSLCVSASASSFSSSCLLPPASSSSSSTHFVAGVDFPFTLPSASSSSWSSFSFSSSSSSSPSASFFSSSSLPLLPYLVCVKWFASLRRWYCVSPLVADSLMKDLIEKTNKKKNAKLGKGSKQVV